jgi:non-ribosomal peptide synthetase component F
MEPPTLELPGLTISALDTAEVAAKFDLQVTVAPQYGSDGAPAELYTLLTYATDLFDEATMQALGRRFERVLTAVAADPRIVARDIDLVEGEAAAPSVIAAPERIEPAAGGVERAAGGVERAAGAGIAIAQSLAAAAEDDPGGPALAFGAGTVSYRELDARSSRLARVLIAHGCGPGVGVALRLARGIDATVATWAVLKSGAAVVPVSEGAAVPVGVEIMTGLTRSDGRGAGSDGVDWLILDDPSVVADVAGQSARPVTYANRVRTLRGTDPAFVTPAGSVDYDELVATVERLRARTALTYESRLLRQGRADSVAAVLEVVAAGAAGATLVLLQEMTTDGLAAEWVTHLSVDRDLLDGLEPEPLEDLQAVVVEQGSVPESFGTEVIVVGLGELVTGDAGR